MRKPTKTLFFCACVGMVVASGSYANMFPVEDLEMAYLTVRVKSGDVATSVNIKDEEHQARINAFRRATSVRDKPDIIYAATNFWHMNLKQAQEVYDFLMLVDLPKAHGKDE